MATIPGWDYDQPIEADVIAELSRALGPGTAGILWSAARKQTGTDQPIEHPDDLIRACEALIHLGEIVRVTGRSGKIRAITYRALAHPISPSTDVRSPA